MSSKDKNLSAVDSNSLGDCSHYKIGIVVSDWHSEITHQLLDAARQFILDNKVDSSNIFEVNVPGSFELPLGAKMLLSSKNPDAVICLGCVITGETKHNEYINHSVARAISQLALVSSKPIIFGLLTPETMEQAIDRAGGKHGNKGVEAAFTALKMLSIKSELNTNEFKIGF
jgi:6,7-dimethyl-8-ribityllumazine synthase